MLAIINTYIDDPDDHSYMIWLYEEFHRLMSVSYTHLQLQASQITADTQRTSMTFHRQRVLRPVGVLSNTNSCLLYTSRCV